MLTRPNPRNTKTQILTAYAALFTEYKVLQGKLKTAQKAVPGPAAAPTPSVPLPTPVMEPEDDTVDTSIASIIGSLESLQSGFGSAASEISGELTCEASRLAEVLTELEVCRTQLKELHDIEVSDNPQAITTDLLRQYTEFSDTFTTQHANTTELFAAELAGTKVDWKREHVEHDRATAERDASLKKEQTREDTQYTYDLKQVRQLDEEKYSATLATRDKELNLQIDVRERTWEQREDAVSAQEREQAEATSKAGELDDRLAAAKRQAAEEGAAIARNQAKVKADLLAREIAGEVQVFELQIESMESRLKSQDDQIAALSAKIETTLGSAQDLAVKAIQGAELSSSFETLKRIALEQARGTQKGK
ncbi:MAG: hypothetical protein ACI8RZ_003878 [Myxococcota bacterium]|jgi:hypothetical protein